MTGPDYDEDDGLEEFRPVPHPDDRLWRHPSEIAAMQAAHANAETAQVPVIRIDHDVPKSRLQIGLMVAAGVVVVGAAALTIGVVSANRSVSPRFDDVAMVIPINNPVPATNSSAAIEISIGVNAEADNVLTARIHDEIAASLPRIQAVTADGMREGSGMFVTDEGHIATSAGLIDSAEYVLAWTEDGQRWKADVVAVDPFSDVAILHIDSTSWPTVSLALGNLWDGQQALAIDHENRSISIGEITSVSSPLVEIDQPAALPGSAIVDDGGAVIAMVTADGTNRHATPSWMLEQVAVDLIASGSTTHVWLGAVVANTPSGDMVKVAEVLAGSPAALAGVRIGDLIDSINGDPVVDAASLHRGVQAAEPGSEVVLTITRNARRHLLVATLTALPG